MDNSVLLARFIGPFIIVIGLAVIINLKVFTRIAEDFFKNIALVYISGLITFVAGLAVVLFHNIWTSDWRVIITIFGWITLIKGIWLIIFPDKSGNLTEVLLKKINLAVIPWSIMLVIGIFLTVKGFF